MELYKQHRPESIADIVGQQTVIRQIKSWMKDHDSIPHAILLSGPSGCGKTTIARIMKRVLRCKDREYTELNIADLRGVDCIRDIRRSVGTHPIYGNIKVWLLDEIAALTSIAQDALLKLLEDPPQYAYFILATTDPQKLKQTIRTRTTEIVLKSIKPKEMEIVIGRICKIEGIDFDSEIIDMIISIADGSARKALVLLDSIKNEKDEEKALSILEKSVSEHSAIELARLLLSPNNSWKKVALMIKELDDKEPEQIRRVVLGYMRNVILSGGMLSEKAANIATEFADNYYDTGKTGLVLSCWHAINAD